MNYYNEFDAKAAQWLRELIKAGLIPDGFVDERSIVEIRADDLRGYDQCHFFAGIGGWSHALRLAGLEGQKGIWSGSCPCQPFSDAGAGLGTADERHLWPAWFRLIQECGRLGFGPWLILGEQVASKAALGWFDGVCADLEGAGYACGAVDFCAASVGAPHIRQRLYWVANRACGGWDQGPRQFGEVESSGRGQPQHSFDSRVGRVDNASGHERESRESLYREHDGEDTDDGREPRRLANPDGGFAGHGGLQPRRQHGQQPQDGGSGRMEHPEGDGRLERGTESVGRGPTSGCSPNERERERRTAWLVHPERTGLEGHSGHEDDRDQPRWIIQEPGRPAPEAGAACFWSPSDLIECTDGKARRTKSTIFPLAHGVPGRVGLLRGAGNAINPIQAARFIEACWEEIT